jgi:succinylglutamate desuccinylase
MNKKVLTIEPDAKISEAIGLMKKNKLLMLPVCEKKLFIGMLQKKFLTQYEFNRKSFLGKQGFSKEQDRVIGNYHTGESKKTILFICGIHGNETSGKQALENIFNHLEQNSIEINGNIIGIQGNLQAIEKKERFVDEDLNRIWSQKNINSLLKTENNIISEYTELKKIHSIIETIIQKKKKNNLVIVDLHNTSSPNGLFTIVNNKKEEKIASFMKIPCITKLFTKVRGSLVQYYNYKGITSLVFEGGAIGDPASIHNHESGIYRMLEKMKFITIQNIPKNILEKEKKIELFSKRKFQKYEVKYIHKINPTDNFIMKVDINNFQKIKKNETIGFDKNGEIKSPINGKILMPLYQSKGSEGFYIIQ